MGLDATKSYVLDGKKPAIYWFWSMSQSDFERAVGLINENVDLAHFTGGVSEDEIEKSSRALALVLPEEFKQYLRIFGTLSFGGMDFTGIPKTTSDRSGSSDFVWETIRDREKYKLPQSYFVVGFTEIGPCLAVNTAGDHPGSVYLYEMGLPPNKAVLERVASSYGNFLLIAVTAAIKNWKDAIISLEAEMKKGD